MLIPQSYPQNLEHQSCLLDTEISLLVWNVHKENQNIIFHKKLKKLLVDKPSDFLLFQEVKYTKSSSFYMQGYSYSLASNIETKRDIYGVLTAAKTTFKEIGCHLSMGKELMIATHKSFLISQHPLSNGELLYLVNIHAINFVSLNRFTQEITKIKNILLAYKGPMIIVGDFNNWSKERVSLLEYFQKELGVMKAEPENLHHVKHVFNKALDHIFYRGLNLSKVEALHIENISDHNPIYAIFRIQKSAL